MPTYQAFEDKLREVFAPATVKTKHGIAACSISSPTSQRVIHVQALSTGYQTFKVSASLHRGEGGPMQDLFHMAVNNDEDLEAVAQMIRRSLAL